MKRNVWETKDQAKISNKKDRRSILTGVIFTAIFATFVVLPGSLSQTQASATDVSGSFFNVATDNPPVVGLGFYQVKAGIGRGGGIRG